MTFEIQIMSYDRHTNVTGFNLLMGHHPLLSDIEIPNNNTDINKQGQTKHVHIQFHSKLATHYHKNEWQHKHKQQNNSDSECSQLEYF